MSAISVSPVIFPDDLLVVDRSIKACDGDTVIAGFNGELMVKQLQLRPTVRLVDCNNFYASCEKLFRPDMKNVPVLASPPPKPWPACVEKVCFTGLGMGSTQRPFQGSPSIRLSGKLGVEGFPVPYA